MSATEPAEEKNSKPVPWATVVMPVRKCAGTVGRSLDGLLQQKVPGPCEIIFVYDMRDDDSRDVILKHPLLKAWQSREIFHPGRGLAQAYNLGWRASKAKYIFNMHSDCYPVKDDCMTQMVERLERENAVAVGPLVDIPQNDWEMMDFWDQVTSSQFRHAKPMHRYSGKFDLIRRDLLEQSGGFDEERFFSSGEDADMVENFYKAGKPTVCDALVIHAHQHPPNARFRSVLRKHMQIGQGSGALFRKRWTSMDFLRRAWGVIAVDSLKLFLPIGVIAPLFFCPLLSLFFLVLLLALSIYYARWAMLSRDWRVVLVPFAVSLMFTCYAMAMVRAFIRGRQTFDYIKAK